MLEKWIYLLSGGLLGTAARFLISADMAQRLGSAFPWGTLLVNLAGCFIIGLVDAVLTSKTNVHTNLRLFLMAGFCGAFTTFSTFMLETSDLLKTAEIHKALLYITLSVAAGFLLFRLGVFVGEMVA